MAELCARCDLDRDGHLPAAVESRGHRPHLFVTWAPPFTSRCRATHAGWQARCDLPRGHEGTHLAERGLDHPEWVEVPALRGHLL
jgi:hypothetical protein